MAHIKVAVLVAGSWGSALAGVLADNGYEVMLWTRNEQQAQDVNASRMSKGFRMPPNVKATSSMAEALRHSKMAVVAAPSSAMRQVAALMRPHLSSDTLIVHAAKGFEAITLKRMSVVLAEELPSYPKERIVVLSGPSHAEEVARHCPTTVVVAAESKEASESAQRLLMNHYFRVYTNADVTGVEISGSLKNIIALGAGLSDGLGFGDNAKAALITRGLAEISRLGMAMGANPLTFAGLAGVGDLVVTCTSRHSRNWRAGYLLAQGKPLQTVLTEVGMVVEGVKTTQAAFALSSRYGVTMPITRELYLVLFENKLPLTAVRELMNRDRAQEWEGMDLPE